MSRLPAVNREVLAPENQEIWDNIAAVRPGMRGGASSRSPRVATSRSAGSIGWPWSQVIPRLEIA